MKYIEQLNEGEKISEIYLCRQKKSCLTKAGKAYDDLTLQDKTGTLNAKIWDTLSGGIEDFEELDYIEVTGDITRYRDDLQLNIKRVRKANIDEYEPSDYLPVSKYDVDEMYIELVEYIDTIKNEYLKTLLSKFFLDSKDFERQFKNHSAAKTVHHGFVGGLLQHTLCVTRLCDDFSKRYPILNRDLLISAAMLHDIGKIEELSEFPKNDYTDSGQLIGHIIIGVEWIGLYIRSIEGFPKKLSNELRHLILAHHGEFEFGSPKKPALIEALALHFADNLDAKIETFSEAIEHGNMSVTSEWLGFNKFLDSNIRKTGIW